MRFAVLLHTLPKMNTRPSHWDLLLQFADCKTTEDKCLDCFELTLPPDQWTLLEVSQLPAHRALYLTYSGPISNDRGSVEQVLAGNIQWYARNANYLEFELFPDYHPVPVNWNANGERFQLARQEKERWSLQRQSPKC
jgi:hypothetical protein